MGKETQLSHRDGLIVPYEKMKKRLHRLIGSMYCRVWLFFWTIRDLIVKPKSNALLVVAHPDDEVLFFHSFLKEHRPYVLVCSGGTSLFRVRSFVKVLKVYGIKGRIYDLDTDNQNLELIKKKINTVLHIKNFDIIATHNKHGEYGHDMHKRVHDAIKQSVRINILCPIERELITHYPLSHEDYAYKINIFKTIYISELFVLDVWQDYLKHERLEMDEENGKKES